MPHGIPCLVCNRLSKTGRCPDHAYDKSRPSSSERGYDHRWTKTRKAFLAANPACVKCGRPAKHAHHLDGLGPLGPRGHDFGNLSALCVSDHNRISARNMQAAKHHRKAA